MANPDWLNFGTEQASTGAITVNTPAGLAAGQLMILYVATDGFTPTLSTPNGFLLAQDPAGNVASVNQALGTCGMHVFWKRAVGGDAMPVIAAPSGGGTVQCCHINTYSNTRAGNPFHKITTATVGTATATINPPGVTTTLAGCTVISLAASANNDSAFNSWGSTGAASPAGSLDSGFNTALGNACSWAGGRGGFAAAGGPRNCTSTFGAATVQAQITFAIASLDEVAASGATTVGGITSAGTTRPGTFASGTASVGGIASNGQATSPGVASGSASVGGVTSTGSAASPALASGTASVGGITSTGQAGQSLFGTVGATAAVQRADQTGPSTGTMSTAFVNRTPSTAVAINDRLIANGRRWHVNTAGTTSAGGGPTGTGIQADGTAQLVALASTDTALTMTTQTSNSVLLACVMRENWANDTSAPTSNKGGTFAIQGSAHFYAGFPSAASAVFALTNATGGAGHAISITWPAKSATGAEVSMVVIEIPTGRSTSFVQATSFVEVAQSATETSASVTTTGPAMLVAFWLGAGGVITIGTEHPANPVAPFVRHLNADTSIAIHNNGYVQAKTASAFVAAPGTYTAQWSGVAEPAQLYLVAIQEAPGTQASGSSTVGGISSAGTTTSSTTVTASGSTTVGGITSAGTTRPGTFASGTASVGGVTSNGSAVTAGTQASGSATVGGVTSAGVTGVSALGAATVGGVASAGAAITGTLAGGAAVVGGISSTGQVTVPGAVSGTSTVGGIASSGAAQSPPLAAGASTVGGIASTGLARAGTFAFGAAVLGGVLSSGAAGGNTAAVGGISSSGAATSAPADPVGAQEDAIHAWVVAGSGLAPEQVIWSDLGPAPPGRYISMRWLGSARVSQDWMRTTPDGTHQVRGTRIQTLELSCNAGAFTGEFRADLVLERVIAARRLPTVSERLARADVGVGSVGRIRSTPGVRSAMLDPRSVVEVEIHVSIAISEPGSTIETVQIEAIGVGVTVARP
jgi:hypothetical protein